MVKKSNSFALSSSHQMVMLVILRKHVDILPYYISNRVQLSGSIIIIFFK